ncbi:bZIP transcription factor 17-like [Wolffia australiana]
MAESIAIDRISCDRSKENEAFDANFVGGFDYLQFPEVPGEMNLDLDLDLDFEGDLDFSVADLLDFPEIEVDPQIDVPTAGETPPLSSSGSGCKARSGISSSSSASLRNSDPHSPDSGDSTTCNANSLKTRVKSENEEESEEKRQWSTKRKKSTDDGEVSESHKLHRSAGSSSDQATSSCVFSPGIEDEEKRKARLMRNRESAQLSRQRKKHYVEELEEKVKSMHSTITELNRKISFIVAENASLRQQMGSGNSSRPAIYPTPMHFPWIAYPPRQQTAHVPLVPIPRLKQQQQISSGSKPRKQDSRKSESKTKKIASVSFLGLLLCMLFIGVFVPGPKNEEKFGGNLAVAHSRGRVLTVAGSKNSPESRESKENGSSGNASEPLFASLYVPRNDKLVKIDGNLIIQSVMANERATEESGSASKGGNKEHGPSDQDRKEATSLAIAGTLGLPLPVSESRRERKEWFQEGLEGPIWNSGICTEVFSFEVAAAVVPAANSTGSSSRSKNRRALDVQPLPIPLPASAPSNDTGRGATSRPVVVNVLIDPRDVNEDYDGVISTKSISRVFVVVLLDSVKYVTYSCVLPFKTHRL